MSAKRVLRVLHLEVNNRCETRKRHADAERQRDLREDEHRGDAQQPKPGKVVIFATDKDIRDEIGLDRRRAKAVVKACSKHGEHEKCYERVKEFLAPKGPRASGYIYGSSASPLSPTGCGG